MPRSKVGKKRPPVQKQNIEAAVEEVLKNKISFREAARIHNVSRATLVRHVKKYRQSAEKKFEYVVHNDVKKVFTKQEETLLVSYLIQAARLHYGLTLREVRILAFQFAKANNKKYPAKWDIQQEAGKQWLRNFRKIYQNQLSLRKPEATSLARSTGFNKPSVAKFFENYRNILKRRQYAPDRIWNCDETGISTVHVPPKVLGPKGTKQVGSMTSSERGTNVTMIAAVNAIGNSVPPMLIFPRVNYKDHMLKGAPPGAIGAAAISGWSNEQLFLKFLNHLIKHVKPSTEDPILLIMDNHESHVSIPLIIKCRKAGINLLTFHPHTSHKMQPLDRTVFGPFKTHYNTAVNNWMLTTQNSGKPVTIYDIAEMVGIAYPLSFTPRNIVNGFKVAGIVPLNPEIFGDEEFMPSLVTDRPEIQNQKDVNQGILEPAPNNESLVLPTQMEEAPSTSNVQTISVITPEAIKPFPKAGVRKSAGRSRQKGKSRILTDTPEKEELRKAKLAELLKKRAQSVKKTVFTANSVPGKSASIKKNTTTTNTKCGKKPKKMAENVDSFTSDDTNEMEFSSNSDDDISLSDELEAQKLEEQLDKDTIDEGDFLLVRLRGKKSVEHYVAKVITKDIEFYVIYLKKMLGGHKFSSKFLLDDSLKIYMVEQEDVVLKLPPPITAGGSARQKSHLKFSVDLSSYNVK